jgi:hypothetical protein
MVDPYPHERPLFAISIVLSALFWIGLAFLFKMAVENGPLVIGVDRFALGAAVLIILPYLVAHLRKARRVAYLRGEAVEVGSKQHPDLFSRLKSTCRRLGIEDRPAAYLFQNPEITDYFSLRFQGASFLGLNGEVIGALTDRQGAIDFVMGQELGRIDDRHTPWTAFLLPASVLPLIGAAYARAKIYSYDRYGIAACKTKVDAAFALAVGASGSRRWKSFNIPQFASQSNDSSGFWMSLDELISPTPWLSKRMAHLRAIATNSESFVPRRHPLAYLIAALVPNIGTRAWVGLLRVLVLALWVAVIVHAGTAANDWLVRHEIIERIAARFQSTPGPVTTSSAVSPVVETPKPEDAYASLDADLEQLGGLALAQQSGQKEIPCEIGNPEAIKLHYRWTRYAFSCDEPVVYTMIEHGEFEPGRVAHIRKYDWKKRRILGRRSER